MKVKLSMAFADLRGKDGPVVIQKDKSGLKLTPRIRARNPKSTAQMGARNNLGKGAKTFANMTAAQAAAWNAYGATLTKKNSISGTTYTSAGIDAFIALSSKFLQINPNGAVPMTPPTTAFVGDTVTLTATGSTGTVTFTSSGANAANVKTELLIQPLKGRNRKPGAKAYVSKGFVAFSLGTLSQTVSVPSGFYACGYRFVNTTTGQATAMVALPVLTVALSIEDGGTSEDSAQEQQAA